MEIYLPPPFLFLYNQSYVSNKPTCEHGVREFGDLLEQLQICCRILVRKKGEDYWVGCPPLHDGLDDEELAPGGGAGTKRGSVINFIRTVYFKNGFIKIDRLKLVHFKK